MEIVDKDWLTFRVIDYRCNCAWALLDCGVTGEFLTDVDPEFVICNTSRSESRRGTVAKWATENGNRKVSWNIGQSRAIRLRLYGQAGCSYRPWNTQLGHLQDKDKFRLTRLFTRLEGALTPYLVRYIPPTSDADLEEPDPALK